MPVNKLRAQINSFIFGLTKETAPPNVCVGEWIPKDKEPGTFIQGLYQDDNVTIALLKTLEDTSSSLHEHNYFEYCIVLEGKTTVHTSTEVKIYNKHNTYSIHPKVPHYVVTEEGSIRLIIWIKNSYLNSKKESDKEVNN